MGSSIALQNATPSEVQDRTYTQTTYTNWSMHVGKYAADDADNSNTVDDDSDDVDGGDVIDNMIMILR